MGVVPIEEQLVQLVDSPKHVWQVELQLRQLPSPTSELVRNSPTGQEAVQVPATAS